MCDCRCRRRTRGTSVKRRFVLVPGSIGRDGVVLRFPNVGVGVACLEQVPLGEVDAENEDLEDC